MLIIGIDLSNEAILSIVDLHQAPEFREFFCGINTAEVVALGWGFSIKVTNFCDGCGGIKGFLSQTDYQRLTESTLIQGQKDAIGIRPGSTPHPCINGQRLPYISSAAPQSHLARCPE